MISDRMGRTIQEEQIWVADLWVAQPSVCAEAEVQAWQPQQIVTQDTQGSAGKDLQNC